jgi:hypothetical protein
MGTQARLTLDSLAGITLQLAESTSGIASMLGRTVAAQASTAESVISIDRRLVAVERTIDNRSRTSTPHAETRETAPKARRNPRTISDPTGSDATSCAALDRLTSEWSNVKPKSPRFNGATLKLAAVNALRRDGLAKPAVYALIRSGTLLDEARARSANVAQTATTRKADNVAHSTPVLVAADSPKVRTFDIPGYTLTVTPVRD